MSAEKLDEKQNLTDLLESLGLTNYESRAYVALLSLGVSVARDVCAQSGVPSSKIYAIMHKFNLQGLVEIQPSKPAKFKAVEPLIGLENLIKTREKETLRIKEMLPSVLSNLHSLHARHDAEEKAFVNLQFGMQNHIQRHLAKLAEAREETCSYFESTCLDGARVYGSGVKKEIVRNILSRGVKSRILLGTKNIQLIRQFSLDLPKTGSIRIKVTRRIHAPFHVIDQSGVVMVIDNPLLKDGRVASLYAIDNKLAHELHEGYEEIWESARDMKALRHVI